MGRQAHFYMLPEDRDAFLRYVQERDPVVVATRDSDSARIKAADINVGSNQTLCLWNRALLPQLRRKWIADPGYYRIDEFAQPVLEFTRSFITTWEGKPALVQGRLYGIFDAHLEKPPEFEKWYDHLVRWIRKNYQKSPTSMGGYVGPAAYKLFEEGAYLLPQVLPPKTEIWLAEIAKQHPAMELPSHQSLT